MKHIGIKEDLPHLKKSIYYLDKLQNLLGIRPTSGASHGNNGQLVELYNMSVHISNF